MSMMRMRRSEWRLTNSPTSNGWRMREEKTCRTSSFENFARKRSSAVLTPYQMKPQMTLKIRIPVNTRIRPSRVTS